jgi:crossover junction endodeoxyribonuclease RuvC
MIKTTAGGKKMIILGIDPGVATIGFGVIDASRQTNRLIQYGTITTPAGIPLSQRLFQISNDMDELIRTFKPDEMAIEELFFNTNLTTGIAVAHGRGVILLSAEKAGLPIFEYTPMQVKQAVVGYGKAEKKQVMLMTQKLLHMNRIPRPDDAADALAIAICHSRSATSLLNTERVFDASKYSTR